MKRFYKDVTTGPGLPDGWLILLDGRPIRTTGKALLAAPTDRMATAIAQEWAQQGDVVQPAGMPLTTLLTTAIDRVRIERGAINQSVLAYLNGDLLCYRAAPDDSGIDVEEERIWGPWLNWFAGRFGHILITTTDLRALEQPDNAHMDVSSYITALDDHRFNVLQVTTSLTGSIVLALAMVEDAITPQEAFQCALCEELYYERVHKLEQHGLAPMDQKQRDALITDLLACKTYLDLL